MFRISVSDIVKCSEILCCVVTLSCSVVRIVGIDVRIVGTLKIGRCFVISCALT